MCTYSRAKAEQRLLAVTTNVASRKLMLRSSLLLASLVLDSDSRSLHVHTRVARRLSLKSATAYSCRPRTSAIREACRGRHRVSPSVLWSLRFCLLPNLLPNLLFKLGHACLGLGLIAGVRLLIPTRLQLARH